MCNLAPISALVCCLYAFAATAQEPQPRQVVPVDGDPFPATVQAIDSAWEITFDTGKETRVLAASELAWWGNCLQPGHGHSVLLVAGDLLVGEVFAIEDQALVVDSRYFGLLRIPLEQVAGIVFRPPSRQDEMDRLLDRLGSDERRSDQVILVNGDELSGQFTSITETTIKFTLDAGPIEFDLQQTTAVALNPALWQKASLEGLRVVAGFADGSRLTVRQMAITGKTLDIELLTGQSWQAQAGDLVCLQPLGGKAVYLSDLETTGYRHAAFLSLDWPYQNDRNVTGGRLRAGGGLYLKGLGMHSASRLTYSVGGNYRTFATELAIDDSAEGGGSVRFRVYVDGQPRFASDIVRGGDPPVPLRLDIKGAKRIDLIADFADRAAVLDRADWLGARLVP